MNFEESGSGGNNRAEYVNRDNAEDFYVHAFSNRPKLQQTHKPFRVSVKKKERNTGNFEKLKSGN